MEVQQSQKPGRKTASKKTETAASAAAPAPVVEATTVAETTTTEKKTRGGKKAAAAESATASPASTEEKNESIIEAAPEGGETTMTDSQEVLTHMTLVAEQLGQLKTKFKSVKEFNVEFSKQFKKIFAKIERDVNEVDGHFSDVLIKIQTTAEKKAGTRAKRTTTASPNPDRVHPLKTPRTAYPFVIKAMGKADGTQVSRNEVQQHVSKMIQAGKDGAYKVIENGEVQKSYFYINKGELGEFFKNIQAEFDKNGATDHEKEMGYVGANGKLPEKIQYKMLMGYVSKCFPPSGSA